jgi:hypothetical protein
MYEYKPVNILFKKATAQTWNNVKVRAFDVGLLARS